MQKIPATVITGFLGAGKTSLIRHVIERANGKRLAFVINEFGDLGVDRDLLLGCGLEDCEDGDVVELTNGCICCTVADDFLPTITALLEREAPPDHIVIETSGLALPKPLVKAFAWPEVRSRTTVDGVIAVVDADAVAAGRFAPDPAAVQAQREEDDALDHDSPLEELFEEQLNCADMVVLNKTDLLGDGALDAIEAALEAQLRAGVRTVRAAHGRVDATVLLGLAAAAEDDLHTRPSHHDDGDHDHDDFVQFRVDLGPIAEPALLEEQLRAAIAAHDVLRIKGFLDVPDKPLRHVVQGVGDRIQRYFDWPWAPGERRSELIVIGRSGLDEAAVRLALGA